MSCAIGVARVEVHSQLLTLNVSCVIDIDRDGSIIRVIGD